MGEDRLAAEGDGNAIESLGQVRILKVDLVPDAAGGGEVLSGDGYVGSLSDRE